MFGGAWRVYAYVFRMLTGVCRTGQNRALGIEDRYKYHD